MRNKIVILLLLVLVLPYKLPYMHSPKYVMADSCNNGVLWSLDFTRTIMDVIAIDDIDMDGVSDIAILVDTNLILLSGLNGDILNNISINNARGILKIDDVTHDGISELLIYNGTTLLAMDVVRGETIWLKYLENESIYSIKASYIDLYGGINIITVTNTTMYIFDSYGDVVNTSYINLTPQVDIVVCGAGIHRSPDIILINRSREITFMHLNLTIANIIDVGYNISSNPVFFVDPESRSDLLSLCLDSGMLIEITLDTYNVNTINSYILHPSGLAVYDFMGRGYEYVVWNSTTIGILDPSSAELEMSVGMEIYEKITDIAIADIDMEKDNELIFVAGLNLYSMDYPGDCLLLFQEYNQSGFINYLELINIDSDPQYEILLGSLTRIVALDDMNTSRIYLPSLAGLSDIGYDYSQIDRDSDFLSDYSEILYHTDANISDTDGDNIVDGVELNVGTDPLLVDTDADGIDDDQEFSIGTDPTSSDTDNDRASDGFEYYVLHTDPTDPDTDDDGLYDYIEYISGTDPRNNDTDQDGVIDSVEIEIGLDPHLNDSDNDGLSDYEELMLGTHPNDIDSDGDGMPDGWEVSNGLDPLNSSDSNADMDNDGLSNYYEYYIGTSVRDPDSDGDGMPDGWEVSNGLDPLNSSDCDGDMDGDGLANIEEYTMGTNPRDSDTDDDGYTDGYEVSHGTDPLNSGERPSEEKRSFIELISIIFLVGSIFFGLIGAVFLRRRR